MLLEVYVPWLIRFQCRYKKTRRPVSEPKWDVEVQPARFHCVRALKKKKSMQEVIGGNEKDMKSLIYFRELTHIDGNLENKGRSPSRHWVLWNMIQAVSVRWANKLLMWGHNRWCSDHIYDWLAIKLISDHRTRRFAFVLQFMLLRSGHQPSATYFGDFGPLFQPFFPFF